MFAWTPSDMPGVPREVIDGAVLMELENLIAFVDEVK
jgi:hypothetical protein